jgi:hypothetical protein
MSHLDGCRTTTGARRHRYADGAVLWTCNDCGGVLQSKPRKAPTTRELVVVELPWIPPAELRGNSRAYWTVRSRVTKDMRVDAFLLTKEIGSPELGPWEKVRVTYEWYHWKLVDMGNLAIGMKAFEDGYLVDSGAVPDDSPQHVLFGEHTFTKCKRGNSHTIVTIEEVT